MPDPPRLEAEFRDAPSISGRIFCFQKTVLHIGRSIVFACFIFANSIQALQKVLKRNSSAKNMLMNIEKKR